MYKIIFKKRLNQDVEQMVIHAPFVARRCQAGQFIILRVDEEGERIPLTITDYNRLEETITIIYQIVGKTTRLLSSLGVGDYLLDFVGPLGKATDLQVHKKVLAIGGGVGIAPLFPQVKKLTEMGVMVEVVLGGRSDAHIILEEDIKALGITPYFATNDGSKGTQGYVTDVVKKLIESGQVYDEVIAIGPLVMMKAVVGITRTYNIPTSVSLNPIMIDGTGMCGGCRVSINGETKFACVDGPDFDGHLVDFDELMRRQEFYKQKESHPHNCKLESAKSN